MNFTSMQKKGKDVARCKEAVVFTTNPKHAHINVSVTNANRVEIARLAEKQVFGKRKK